MTFVGIYAQTGSVNEWLHIASIGLFGDGHWSYLSYTASLPAVARALGVDTPEGWRTLTNSLAVLSMVVFASAIRKLATSDGHLVLILTAVFFTPLPSSVFSGQADYDSVTLLGFGLLFFAHTPIGWALVGLLIGATNAEQGLVALICLALISLALDRKYLRGIIAAGLATIISALIIRLALLDEEINNRGQLIAEGNYRLLLDFDRTGRYLPHLLGAGGLLLAVLLAREFKLRNWLSNAELIVALVLIPLLVFATTTDGTRTFALVAAPGSLLAAALLSERLNQSQIKKTIAVGLAAQVIYLVMGGNTLEPRWPTILENSFSWPRLFP